MKATKKTLTIIFLLVLWLVPTSALSVQNLEKGIRFLGDVEEVDWYLIDGKNIIIGWKGIPDSFYGWNHRTAVRASMLSLYKVSVWSVRHSNKEWHPGEGGQICITTAERGRLRKTSCRK
jgi:hypothetical protein